MTKLQRISNILTGLVLILISILIFVIPESGYPFAVTIIGLTLTLTGLGLEAGTVKSRIYRAKSTLRTILQEN